MVQLHTVKKLSVLQEKSSAFQSCRLSDRLRELVEYQADDEAMGFLRSAE